MAEGHSVGARYDSFMHAIGGIYAWAFMLGHFCRGQANIACNDERVCSGLVSSHANVFLLV
jgi:hypothetical protein